MADTKISAATDAGTLLATDMLPLARSGSTSAYHATMTEIGVFANASLPVASTTTAGVVKVDGSTITISSGVIASVSPVPYGSLPAMDGTANAGAVSAWSRGDHVHPIDTSRAPLASPALTGAPTAPTPTTGDNSTKLATTAFVQAQMVASGAGVSSWNSRAGAVVLQQSDLVAQGDFHDAGRNRMHNSGFSINQRSYVSGTALAAGAYAHDRWKAGSGGCTYTFTQTQPLTTITITAGSLQQIIEAMSVAGGTYTLSWTGTAQGRVNAGTYAASPVTVTGLAVNTAITVEFNAGTLGPVQLEVGSVATPFDAGGTPADQLRQCQRFYQVGRANNWSYNAAGQLIGHSFPLPVTMRAAPTVAFANTTYTNASGIGAQNFWLHTLAIYASATAAGTAAFATDYTASADL